jgi:hypothetical protein
VISYGHLGQEIDDKFDFILRRTYYKYRANSIDVEQICQLDDMVKLKNAKSSTKERLMKTLKK